MTQPSLYHENLTEDEQNYLYGGAFRFVPPASNFKHFTAKASYLGLKAFNDVTRKVALEQGIMLIDLANSHSKDETTFYDNCHMLTPGIL